MSSTIRSVLSGLLLLPAAALYASPPPAPLPRVYAVDVVFPVASSDPTIEEARRAATKAFGEDARHLLFLPITPCTIWDTRFATDPVAAGAIGDNVTRRFYSHGVEGIVGDPSYTTQGGNPSCPETSGVSIAGGSKAGGFLSPFAVMMTVYTSDATGNGWLTFYRDGDPDPSTSTISVYYAAGPTKTQTVIAKSGRGFTTSYGNPEARDVAVTGRFGSVHAAASVVGYFVKNQNTMTCLSTVATLFLAPGSRGSAEPACVAGYLPVSGGAHSDDDDQVINVSRVGSNGWYTAATNTGASGKTFTFFSRCCRVLQH
jgi:hypothetical protein